MTSERSTIAALSSGAVPSGIAVIRLSGPRVPDVLETLAGALPQPRRLSLRTLRDAEGQPLDKGLVAYFPAPDSFTGEDCAELHLHGSRAVVAAVLSAVRRIDGVVLAGAGDFTRRAFEAGKLDLTSVEGIADLIAAETESQRKQALSRSTGQLAGQVAVWRADLITLLAEVEARLDFSEEDDVGEALPQGFADDLDSLATKLKSALAGYESGRITRDGFRVVLAGAPNAGKSSLLNALAGSEEAIVSPEAGTTRDVKEVQLDLGGQLVRLFDVAGLRASDSLAETEGVRRAQKAIAEADLVFWLTAPDVADVAIPETQGPVWLISTKSDLGVGETGASAALAVSSVTDAGLDALKVRLAAAASEAVAGEAALISHLRDKESIEKALENLAQARACGQPDEILAENLRLCGQALARLTGEIDAEHVLDRLFAGFCIGK